MILVSIVFAFYTLGLAVNFFPNTKWTWIFAPIVMFVYTYLTFRFLTTTLAVIFVLFCIVSVMGVYAKHFINKR